MERTDLAVGDSARLEIIFSTKRYHDRVVKSPRIETNAGPPHKTVRIVSHVVSPTDSTHPLVIKPFILDLSQFGDEVRDELEFSLTNVSDRDLGVTLIDRPEGHFILELPSSVDANSSAKGTLRLTDDALDESFEKSVTIQLNDETGSRFTIPIKRSKLIIDNPQTNAAGKSG